MINVDVFRFLNYVENYSDVNTCWLWKHTKLNGYGLFYVNGKSCYAHRWLYVECFGEIPEHLVLDHLCNVRACVNPQHMEPVSLRENTRRGSVNRRNKPWEGFCKHGHEKTPETLYINPKTNARACRKCKDLARGNWPYGR